MIYSSRLRLSDVLLVGTVGLRARLARTALTALGIAIGIAAMVAVVGISASSRAAALAQIDRLGTNLLEVTPGQTFLGQASTLPTTAPGMVRRIGPVQRVAPVGNVKASVRRSELIPSAETGGIAVRAIDSEFYSSLEVSVRAGRVLEGDFDTLPAAVLGSASAKALGISNLASSPAVVIGSERFTVIGILEPIELVPALDRSVFVGSTAATERLGFDGKPSTIYVRTDQGAVDAVRNVLPATVNPPGPNEVRVTRPSDALEARATVDRTLTALLLGLGGVALVVGGVGIANIMVISVLERRGEIGLRRALGATRRHIRLQFLVESMSLSAIGGLAGVCIGVVITAWYAARKDWTLSVPAWALAAAASGAVVVGAVAGLYPASRAARLAPADAVRAS